MSATDKLIIPLLDENITLDDISPEAGFIGVYSEDINRPYLDNHIFLLYDAVNTTTKAYVRNQKLRSSKYLYGVYNVNIVGNEFILYAFNIVSRTIKNIKRNAFVFTDNERLRIFKFWNFTDVDINKFLLDPLYFMSIGFVRAVVPEEDYKPSCELVYDEKSGALHYRNVPL